MLKNIIIIAIAAACVIKILTGLFRLFTEQDEDDDTFADTDKPDPNGTDRSRGNPNKFSLITLIESLKYWIAVHFTN